MLDSKKLFMAPFCGETPCEDDVKKTSARCVQSGVCGGEGGEVGKGGEVGRLD